MCLIAKLKKNVNITTPEGRAVGALTRKAGFCDKMKTHNYTLSIREQLKMCPVTVMANLVRSRSIYI